MMKLLRKFFGFKDTAAPISRDQFGHELPRELRLATAALLIEAAQSDGKLPQIEVSTVRDILGRQFAFTPEEVDACIDSAVRKLASCERIEEITGAIRENFSYEQRVTILSLLWQVVLSDGTIDRNERKKMHVLQFQLGLNDEHLEEARVLAEQGRVGGR